MTILHVEDILRAFSSRLSSEEIVKEGALPSKPRADDTKAIQEENARDHARRLSKVCARTMHFVPCSDLPSSSLVGGSCRITFYTWSRWGTEGEPGQRTSTVVARG